MRDNTTGTEKHVMYIGGTPYESNIVYLKNYTESSGSYKFLHKDYLGSILAITDETGNIKEQRHFDAWGNLTHYKVNGVTKNVNEFNNLSLIDRGYTSHEYFTEVGIIHMNGRLYDPLLRRFLNADENIQDPQNTQNYNKYGYVLNNPLMHNDPTGEIMGWDDALIAIGIAIFTSVATDYYLNRPVNFESMFQSVVMSLMSAGISNGIGDVFRAGGKIAESLEKTGTIIARAGAHAIAQGTLSFMQGGNFWSGALSGAFASVAGDLLKLGVQGSGKNSFVRTGTFKMLTGALMGGLGSKLGGGNFWQGAAVGAIVTFFNHLNHEEPPVDFNDDFYHDPKTGLNYVKISDYLYEIYDQNLQPIGDKYISAVQVGKIFSEFRNLGSGFSNAGDAITAIGFILTVTVVGAELGVPLMAVGSAISNVGTVINVGAEIGRAHV